MVGSLSLVLTQFSPQLSNGSVLCGEHLLHVLILRGRVELDLQLLRGTGVIGRTLCKHKYTTLFELNGGGIKNGDTNYSRIKGSTAKLIVQVQYTYSMNL